MHKFIFWTPWANCHILNMHKFVFFYNMGHLPYSFSNLYQILISGFKDFGSCLAKDIRAVEKNIGLVNENQEHLVQRKYRQEVERTDAIKTSCLMYKSQYCDEEIVDYLKNHHTGP
jgi:hypothetical protein